MKKRTKDIINILCYIGILLLVIIILLPPVLRFVLPDNDDFENEIKIEMLSCSYVDEQTNTKKIINTHYKNDIVQKVEIIYEEVNENSIIEEKNFYNLSGVEVNEDNDVININIIPNNNNKTRLSMFFKPILEQKSIYEDGDYNYQCEIVENSN